jgi:acyl-CoA thioester hydrolase
MMTPMHVPSNAFAWPVTVSERDIDVQNHASNVAVVDWMNRAAWEHSKQLGFDAADYQKIGGMFVVRRHEIDYRAQAMLGDQLLCWTWPCYAQKATAHRKHRVIRQSDGVVIAEGFNIWAFVSVTTGRPTRMPEPITTAFDPRKWGETGER